jgi:hypothetical protein
VRVLRVYAVPLHDEVERVSALEHLRAVVPSAYQQDHPARVSADYRVDITAPVESAALQTDVIVDLDAAAAAGVEVFDEDGCCDLVHKLRGEAQTDGVRSALPDRGVLGAASGVTVSVLSGDPCATEGTKSSFAEVREVLRRDVTVLVVAHYVCQAVGRTSAPLSLHR